MSRIFQKVTYFIQKRPLLFNSIVYGSFYTGAEFVQQSYAKMFKLPEAASVSPNALSRSSEDKEKPKRGWLVDKTNISSMYDWAQLRQYAIYGCFLAGPVLHVWYKKIILPKLPVDWMTIARYVFLGTLVLSIYHYRYKWLDRFYKGRTLRIVLVKLFADQFILTPPLIFMFFVSMSVMENRTDVFKECRVKFVQTFKTSCMYWLPVQFFNFMVVPPAFRVSFVGVAAFCWVNILCYLKSVPVADYEKGKIRN